MFFIVLNQLTSQRLLLAFERAEEGFFRLLELVLG